MAVRIRDTFLRDTVELVPRDPGKVSIYVCGPTVYDVAHVGHGRTALIFDVIRRYLEWTGLDVDYVSNITDETTSILGLYAKPVVGDVYELFYLNPPRTVSARLSLEF